MLDQSARELRITVEELEKRYEAIESEGMFKFIFHMYHDLIFLKPERT